MAANLSSGNLQSYDPGHGAKIMKGVQPDIVLIQEFNYGSNSTSDLRGFVTNTFGAEFAYYHQGDYDIPNGVISRYPILASGSWDDPQVSNREFAWARIDIPGPKDLWAVSVHMLTTDSKRPPEAIALRNFIQANVPEGDYFVLGGDFNSDSRTETMYDTLSAVVRTDGPYPVDKNGNANTNAGRNSPYDAVLPDEDLYALQVPVVIGSQTFTNGLVVDTRVFTPISDIAPALSSDSAASGMQHMGVVRDFQIPSQGPAILTATLPGVILGQSYSQTLAASGGTAPYTWSVASGSLPAGITLSGGGILSGTPSATGSSTFTIQAQDGAAAKTTRSFTIAVNPALALVSTSPLAGGTISRAYSQAFAASGGFSPYTWSVTGTPPTGLTLSSAGVFSGTPTVAGTFTFTARVTDSTSATVSAAFTVTINPALVIASVSPFTGGTVGAAYSKMVVATGGTPPLTWTVSSGTVRPGLTFSADGLLSGTPTTAGTGSFTARVTDAAGATITKSLSVTIAAAPVISSPSPLAGGTVGSPYSQALAKTGGTAPYVWDIASGILPDGVGLSEAGVLGGTPANAGAFTINARLTDGAGAVVTKSLSFTIAVPLGIATASLPGGTSGTAYSRTLATSGGTAPYTWSLLSGTLPAGLSFTSGGILSGTPGATGTYNFTLRVADGTGASVTQSYSVITAAALSVTTTTPMPGTVGAAYSQALASGGGTAPYTWVLASGTLPGGITFSPAGLLEGTPTAAGNFNFVVRVTDGAGATITKSLSISVSEPVTEYLVAAGLPPASFFIDSDNDGIVNLLEFLLGGNPNASDASIVPVLGLSPDGVTVTYTFRVTSSPGSVAWKIKSSGNLAAWDDVAIGGGTTLSSVPGPSGSNDITLTMPAPAAPFYLRLEATGP